MKVVIDTNVLLSALVFRGLPAQLLLTFEGAEHSLCTSSELLAELEEVLNRKKFERPLAKTSSSAERLFEGVLALARVVKAAPLTQAVSRDKDDDAVLACALASSADLIVSGDDDLLVLGQFKGIPILPAREALALLQRAIF
jgi:uncharacterized protein